MMGNDSRLNWRLPAVSAVISAALGIAISFAADLKTSTWAWIAVGALVLASVPVSLAADSMKRRRDEVRERAATKIRIDDTFANSGSKIESGSISQAGRDFAGRDIHHHKQPLLRTVIVVSAVVWLTAAGGLIVGAQLQKPANANAPQVGDTSSTLGTLSLSQSVRDYYPNNGVLPDVVPPPYDHNDIQQSEDFCGIWADWAKT